MNETVSRNLRLMTDRALPGNLYSCIIHESAGGNAGFYKKFHCVGANFVYVLGLGEIKYFESPEDKLYCIRPPPDTRCSIFRVAIQDISVDDLKFRIVNWKHINEDQASVVLSQTVEEYNRLYGFELFT